MDDIITLKNKHMKIMDSQMKELLQSQMKLMNHVKNKQDQHSNEDETKIKELKSKIASMMEKLQSEKQTLGYMNHDLSKHSDCITELEAEKNKFLEENQSLELERNKFRMCKSNLQDQQLLDQGRKKYLLYKELTRIRWDFESLKETVKGYVTNRKDYIHHFSYERKNFKDLSNLLWQEIEQSTVHTESEVAHNKENAVQNTQL